MPFPRVSSSNLNRSNMIDAEREAVLAGLVQHRVEPNWNALSRIIEPDSIHVVDEIVRKRVSRDDFAERFDAAILNGVLLSRWAEKNVDRSRFVLPPAEFAFSEAWTPEQAVEYWRKKIPLTPEQAASLLNTMTAVHVATLAIPGEYSRAIMRVISNLFARAIREGMALAAFRKAFRESIPSFSKALMEALFRTNITKAYGTTRLSGILRAPGITHIRYIGITDDRIRPTHRAVHGFIAAKTDGFWLEWTPPNGWNCRCDLQPIDFYEALRLGIAGYGPGGRGVVLIGGSRPYGDPPRFVELPNGTLKRVAPDIGFTGADKRIAVVSAVA